MPPPELHSLPATRETAAAAGTERERFRDAVCPPSRLLCGASPHILDRKGRLVLPRELAPPGPLMVCRVPERALLVLPEERWQALLELEEGRVWREYLLTGAHRINRDPRSGRILLPALLRTALDCRPFETLIAAGLGEAVLIMREADYQRREAELARWLVSDWFGRLDRLEAR